MPTFQRRNCLGDEVPVGYLRQCVVNACRSVHRHRGVQRRTLVPLHLERAEPERPDDLAERDDAHARMMAALHALPQRQQVVLVFRYYGQRSEVKIAEVLGVSRGAVKSHAHRGLAALRARLDDEGDLR